MSARVEKELPVLASRPRAAREGGAGGRLGKGGAGGRPGKGGAGGRPGKGGMGDRERRENGRERDGETGREGEIR